MYVPTTNMTPPNTIYVNEFMSTDEATIPKLLDVHSWEMYANIPATHEVVPINNIASITMMTTVTMMMHDEDLATA